MALTDPLNLLLNGQTPPFVPVAPAYEGLGPLQFHRMTSRYQKWRDRLAAAYVHKPTGPIRSRYFAPDGDQARPADAPMSRTP